jgi:tetratricopeptide (TPR) repeat protein
MAEGLVEGIVGTEGDSPATEAAGPLAGAEAFAAAVVAIASRQDPEVARKTEAFLSEQTELLKVQKEHLKDEHAARLQYLRGQAREVDIRRFGLRLRVGLQVFTAFLATIAGIGIVLLVLDAIRSRSVVIDPFEVSPNIAADVPSGKIIAIGLLDRLSHLQAATRTSLEKRDLANSWNNEITVEIPETGLSISQLERALRSRLGHDQQIDGDVVRTKSGGLALTVRGIGVPSRTFADASGDLETLLTRAADYVYGEALPSLFVNYLKNAGRLDEAIAFAKSHLGSVGTNDKAVILDQMAEATALQLEPNSMQEALIIARESVRIKPDNWPVYVTLSFALSALGDEEGAVRTYAPMIKLAGGRPGKAPERDYLNYDWALYDLQAVHSDLLSDIAASSGGSLSSQYGSEGLQVAWSDVLLHDLDAARVRLSTTSWDEKSQPDVASASAARALMSQETEDWPSAARAWDTYATAYVDREVSVANPPGICWAALAYEKSGQPAKADAALDAPGKKVGISTFVDCYRFRGDVLDQRGDWAGAQIWYAKAAGLAPSIPSGSYSWGTALAKHGDLDDAIAKFRDANQRGPHWADPLKAWGDVLVKQGNTSSASVKYEEALKYAPNWKQLKEALKALGKHKT